jgi:hypothetical protein
MLRELKAAMTEVSWNAIQITIAEKERMPSPKAKVTPVGFLFSAEF